jgi:hypothetical protein
MTTDPSVPKSPIQVPGSRGWIVVTSINPPTTAIKALAELCRQGWSAVVVGDTKTPADWHQDNIHYLSVDEQKKTFGAYADLLPYRHYCRKNLGYLYALSKGADYVLETDDDNIPYDSFGKKISRAVAGRRTTKQGWVNVYKCFTKAPIWPRGLPLDEIQGAVVTEKQSTPVDCAIQQYLADTDPDVDAIYRLTCTDEVDFDADAESVVLEKGSWVPFNSQNTLFFKDVFPLLYLPCHVSFRMTDIWRSFVAQAALWVHGGRLAFHPSTVKQIRNPHDLMRDFRDEVVGYLENRRIGKVLEESMERMGDAEKKNLESTAMALWMSLVQAGIVPEKEVELIKGWFAAVRSHV